MGIVEGVALINIFYFRVSPDLDGCKLKTHPNFVDFAILFAEFVQINHNYSPFGTHKL